MNYNPYYYMTPYIAQTPIRNGVFGSFFRSVRGINWSSILGGTQKALNIANQAIPVIRQITPMINNAKTMFRVMNEFKKVETPETSDSNEQVVSEIKETDNLLIENSNYNDGPTFFV